MENKYYTPSIEDIRVGYECELKIHSGYVSGKFPEILKENQELSEFNDDLMKFAHAIVRTPYLTKEQIEAEGWEFSNKSIDLWFEKPGIILREDGHHFTRIILTYGLHDKRLKIKPVFTSGEEECFFEGECKSINEFRTICKLLNI